MRKMLATALLVSSTMLVPGLVPEARASHDWLAVGGGFAVGRAHISFVFGRPSFYRGSPAYYFRYDRPISYRGHRCSDRCFRDGGHYYHHESCSVVGAHFRNYDVDPYWAYANYAPRFSGYDSHYDNGYYGDRGYGRDRGYSRDDRYRDRGHRDRGYSRGDDRRYRNPRESYDWRRNRGNRGHGKHRHNRHCRH